MTELALIRHIEEASFGAWPALAQVLDDGWVLRFAEGHSKRANSVNPTYASLSDVDVDAKIDRAEGWYRARDLPPLFRLTPLADPDDIDQRLAARGFQVTNPGRAFYHPILRSEASSLPANVTLRLDAGPREGWLDAYLAIAPLDAGRAATLGHMLDRIVPASCFGWLSEEGRPLAAAFVVVQGGLMGTYDVVTAPAARRRGLMQALLGRLTDWAMVEGATAGALFVVGGNEVAAALYQKLGYQELYHYHYRIAAAL
jgi:GNAT superfamily N-acetyltransferase